MNKPIVIRPTSKGLFPKLEDGIHEVALGNMSQFKILMLRWQAATYIGVLGKKCYHFVHAPSPVYIEEKIGLEGSDAMNLADFIACQMGIDGRKSVGEYMAKLCSDAPHRNG